MTTLSSIHTAEALFTAGDIGRCELVRGTLHMMSPASPEHGRIANRIAHLLTTYILEHDLGEVFAAETGFIIARNPDTVRAPDVAFVGSRRISSIPQRGFFPGAPDLAVEVVSPDDSAMEVEDKVRSWLAAGADEVWVAYPRQRRIVVHVAGADPAVFPAGSTLSGRGVLAGLSIPVDEVFPS